MQSFVECRDADRKTRDQWFLECERLRIPCVYVATKRKSAYVDWDCFTLGGSDEDRIAEHAHQIAENILAVVRRYPKARVRDNSCEISGTIEDLTPEEARVVAEEVFAILQRPLLAAPAA